MQKEPYYTVSEVSEYLKIKPELVRSLIRRKRLGANYIGGEYRISAEDLEKFEQETHTSNQKEETEDDLVGAR